MSTVSMCFKEPGVRYITRAFVLHFPRLATMRVSVSRIIGQSCCGWPSHASLALALLAAICIARPVVAQVRCDEATVRRLAATSVTELASPNIYFNVQTGRPPVIGTAQLDTLRMKHGAERKNEKPHVFTILQVDATADGSMAYDDGSVHVEFDDAETGRHVVYDLSYLRVWKVVGKRCLTVAMYGRRGDQERP
jgi:hypothetical protein